MQLDQERLNTNMATQSQVSQYDAFINKAAAKYGVNPSVIKSIIGAESSGNPKAVSPKGAQGLMQLMPTTGKYVYGLGGYSGGYDPFNPEQNIDIGTRYYSELLKRYKGDEKKALAAYNMGPGALDSRDGKPYDETEAYVKKVSPSPGQAVVGAAKDNALMSLATGGAGGAALTSGINAGGAPELLGSALGADSGALGAVDAIAAGPTNASAALQGLGTAEAPLLGSAGTLLGAGAVGAYYAPSYMKYGSMAAAGKSTKDSIVKSAALTNPVTAWAVPIADKFGLGFGGGKDQDQVKRDGIRAALKQAGIIDENYGLDLQDGSKYDIGADGHAMLQSSDGSQRHAYDVDFKNPLAHQSVGWANPLAIILGGGDKKVESDFAGYLTNAWGSKAKSLEDVRANAMTTFKKFNMSTDQAKEILKGIRDSGKMSKEEYDAAVYGLATLTSGKYDPKAQYQPPNKPTTAVTQNQPPKLPVPQNATDVTKNPVTNVINNKALLQNTPPASSPVSGTFLAPGAERVDKIPTQVTDDPKAQQLSSLMPEEVRNKFKNSSWLYNSD